jgi:hypothetical protein
MYLYSTQIRLFSIRQESNDSVRLEITIRELQPNPGENQEDFLRRTRAEMIAHNAANGTLPFDKAEFERLPNKEPESQIDEEILNDVLQVLENYLGKDDFLHKFGTKCGGVSFIAAQFKNNQMKTSSLSPAMIEAALTIIIKQMNDEHTGDNERYAVVKQSPFTISYTDDDKLNMKGVRVFQVTAKNPTN